MKALKAGRPRTASPRQLGGRNRPQNDRRALATDEVVGLGSRCNSLKGESRTWLRGETNPRGSERSKPSRACETLRADRRARPGKLARKWTPGAGVAMGKGTPRKAPRTHACGQVRSGKNSEEEIELRRG
jgi:hypothetical protein